MPLKTEDLLSLTTVLRKTTSNSTIEIFNQWTEKYNKIIPTFREVEMFLTFIETHKNQSIAYYNELEGIIRL